MAQNQLYLTYEGFDCASSPDVCVVSVVRRAPQLGDARCEVMTCDRFHNVAAAEAWFERVRVERPWEQRQ